jgi:hypothetical protein
VLHDIVHTLTLSDNIIMSGHTVLVTREEEEEENYTIESSG